jgi:hypothetical protein
MAIGSFADDNGGSVERELIILSRGLLELSEIQRNYGPDPENPQPYSVTNKDGEHLFNADPSISALVTVVDDYGDGSLDGKQFWDRFFLKKRRDADVWEAGQNSKLGMVIKTMPKYGPEHFVNPKPFEEDDLDGHQFEAGTEQREDRSGKKLEGTRIEWASIGAVPDRDAKKNKQAKPDKAEKARKEADEQIDQEVDDHLAAAEVNSILDTLIKEAAENPEFDPGPAEIIDELERRIGRKAGVDEYKMLMDKLEQSDSAD